MNVMFNVAILTLIAFVLSKSADVFFHKNFREPEPKILYRIFSESPTPLILLSGIFGFSYYPVIPPSGLYLFGAAVLLLAVLTPIIGFVEGLVLGIKLHKGLPPEEKADGKRIDYEKVKYFAKFGGITKDGKAIDGRFDISLKHVVFAGLCNVSGAACSVAILSFLHTLPGFDLLRANMELVNYFEVLLTLAIFYALIDVSTKQQQEPYKDSDRELEFKSGSTFSRENPKNFRFSRPHVLANFAHLVFTFFYCFTSVFFILAYAFWSRSNIGAPELGIQFVFVIVTFFVFLTYALGSVQGNKYGPDAAKGYIPSVFGLVVGAAIIMAMFKPSYVHIVAAVLLAVCLVSAFILVKKTRKGNPGKVLSNVMFWAPIIVSLTILVLVALFNNTTG